MCLMSAPAAKNPGTREATTSVLTSPVSSAWSSAALSPSMIGRPSAFAGARCSRMVRRPSSPRSQPTTDCSRSALSGMGPLDGPGDEDVAAQRTSEHTLDVAARLEQRLDVDARLDAHLVQHRDQVLRRDVAGGAGRDGAAAELAEARLEALDPGVQRGQHVSQPLTARVVEV